MSLVPAICPCCSASIEIPSGQDRCFCSYCGTQILTEAAVAFAKVRVEGTVQTKPADFVIKAGTLMEYHGESRDVVIPEGVVAVDARCFSGCKALRSVRIPEGATSIEEHAFFNCGSLESVSLPSTLKSIGSGAFHGCSSLESIVIPEGATSIGSYAFQGCSSLESIVVPEGVTSIGIDTFHGCTSLQKVTLPSTLTSIRANAFSGCDALRSISLPENVVFSRSGCKEDGAFFACVSLESVKGYKADMEKQFGNTPFLKAMWMASRRCQYCGGNFKGLLLKNCSACGKEKDYK